jgi:hypothetical protein
LEAIVTQQHINYIIAGNAHALKVWSGSVRNMTKKRGAPLRDGGAPMSALRCVGFARELIKPTMNDGRFYSSPWHGDVT